MYPLCRIFRGGNERFPRTTPRTRKGRSAPRETSRRRRRRKNVQQRNSMPRFPTGTVLISTRVASLRQNKRLRPRTPVSSKKALRRESLPVYHIVPRGSLVLLAAKSAISGETALLRKQVFLVCRRSVALHRTESLSRSKLQVKCFRDETCARPYIRKTPREGRYSTTPAHSGHVQRFTRVRCRWRHLCKRYNNRAPLMACSVLKRARIEVFSTATRATQAVDRSIVDTGRWSSAGKRVPRLLAFCKATVFR